MLRLWLTPRWVLATLLAVLFGVACVQLGSWQWRRHIEQETKVRAIETNYAAAPVPLSTALPPDGELRPEAQWQRVVLEGAYGGPTLFVRNRTLDQRVGFGVVTPFTSGGTTLLVDRGWVQNADDAETTPPVDAAPTGQLRLTGWLRTGEPDLERDLPAPHLASISVASARRLGAQLSDADVYLVLGEQSPAARSAGHPLTPLPRPDEGLGPHQAYAYQWWLTSPLGLVFVVMALRREARTGPRSERPPKPRKVRIWDEEDA